MIGPGIPGAVMEAFAEGFACGQAGILTVTIDDGNQNNVLPQTTANIVQIECGDDGFAVYRYLGVYPSDPALSPYLITWEGASATDPLIDTTASEEIEVSTDAPVVPSGSGPCQEWITAADVAACCGDLDLSSDNEAALETAARSSELFLFAVSGRFSGLCGPVTVRPPQDRCSNCGTQWLAYPTGASVASRPIGGAVCGACGFSALSRVLLSGYPVQGIAQVKIDGAVVAPSEYRLDGKKWLVRKDNGRWPVCPDVSLDDDEEGTFSVSYWYGETPNQLALNAAAALACEFYNACSGGECRLPTGAVRIVRQGVTIDRLQPLASMLRKGETGILAIDAFMEAYGKHRRRSGFWSFDGPQHARRVGA